ncbi:cobyrinate a,c-diamide synthase [Sphingobium aquiterrae]|uniref:cobyrinate a,c-diamide synthase n=1 Tax=Sphingobium aquiterrae TaxID=2038656 RepID=UPI0030192140
MRGDARCPALLVAAPASGQGKTLVTAALARRHRMAGRRVRVFKCGPDFLDPMILECASGAPVHQLDLFMGGEAYCRALLHEAARDADVILVEGVMGLFDGHPSAADLAARFGLPVLAVVDGSAMAQSFGALVHGLASYRDDIGVSAVLANRVAGARHAGMLRDSLRGDVRWLGALFRDGGIALPERHLGLVQAQEIDDLDARIERAAALLSADAQWLPPPVSFAAPDDGEPPRLLEDVRIAVARDDGFAFLYPANLALLERMGARLRFFSPIRDGALPPCDALWLPGGYPELHLRALAGNIAMMESIRAHHALGRPILAECGGMLYCARTLADVAGEQASMLGLLDAGASMQPRLSGLGLQEVTLPEGHLRGHSFHYSRLETAELPLARTSNPNGGVGEAVYRRGSLTASYVHFYFPSCPAAVAALFTARHA